MVASLWDREAFPWQADWYRRQVLAHFDGQEDDHFRLLYTERALHGDTAIQEDLTRTVSHLGILHQALRDVSAWVEHGIAPPASTQYRIEDGQVVIPMQAAQRKGIQPVVTLQADRVNRAIVKVGRRVRLAASAETPPGGRHHHRSALGYGWRRHLCHTWHGSYSSRWQSVDRDRPGIRSPWYLFPDRARCRAESPPLR